MEKTLLLGLIVGAVATIALVSCVPIKKAEVIEIFHTTDVHGNFLPYDFISDEEGSGSLARVSAYVGEYRKSGSNVLLLEGGDLLQGQPTAYYYNFVDTLSPHLASQVLNYMQYDAAVIGNHDIETGHSVYDRYVKELSFPMLGGNVLSVSDKTPYLKPYTIVQKGSKKIAIIGLTTPELTQQLPEVLWRGLSFEDQLETAKAIMPEIKKQKPDFIIALVHTGSKKPNEKSNAPRGGNAGYQLATELTDVNLVFCGHDHVQNVDSITHKNGSVTYIVNPGPNADLLSHVTVTLKGKKPLVTVKLADMKDVKADPEFVDKFSSQMEAVKSFVSNKAGRITASLDAKESFFGPSRFNDLIHDLQFSVFPSAQISLTAPLAETTVIPAGDLFIRDLFKLYKYENMVYLMSLTGSQVKGLLEESYDRWIHTMTKSDDPLIRIDESERGGLYLPLENPSFNFDTAAGISYTVDASKPMGERVVITRVGTDEPFDLQKSYQVVVNSYRGNGGGGLLTEGAKMTPEEIKAALIESTDKDLRYYLMLFIKEHDPYTPHQVSDWRFVPDEWMKVAIPRDSTSLFKK